jgi:hypothetical protein
MFSYSLSPVQGAHVSTYYFDIDFFSRLTKCSKKVSHTPGGLLINCTPPQPQTRHTPLLSGPTNSFLNFELICFNLFRFNVPSCCAVLGNLFVATKAELLR